MICFLEPLCPPTPQRDCELPEDVPWCPTEGWPGLEVEEILKNPFCTGAGHALVSVFVGEKRVRLGSINNSLRLLSVHRGPCYPLTEEAKAPEYLACDA